IRDRKPQVLITYDENGFYGHPDHVQAHRVATYAALLAAVPSYRNNLGEPWQVQRLLWLAIAESNMRAMIAGARGAVSAKADGASESPPQDDFFGGFDLDSDELPPMSTRDSDVAVRVDGYPYAVQRFAALRAHATQIKADEFFFAFEHAPAGPMWAECYRLAAGVPFDAGANDVFAGLGLDR
ncbi:MAG: N-acetyl-1-D-myo-inositol-2-amino-2-deoxy-alpha-D-glucopyranoside deacetylase, partial [Actinomycetota bacterium]|nr:N-acetyl-1-D-myo-inositol-2-amino-2-deoxy-alpha-D-glucopyranoside deacetylase [Actinomycetota bacterium]